MKSACLLTFLRVFSRRWTMINRWFSSSVIRRFLLQLHWFEGRPRDFIAGAVVIGALFHEAVEPLVNSHKPRRSALQVFRTEMLPEDVSFEPHPLARVWPNNGEIIAAGSDCPYF